MERLGERHNSVDRAKMLGKWIFNILISFDRFANALFGGDPEETISSRAGKALNEDKIWGKVLCPVLDWLDPEHCISSINDTEGDDEVF